MAVNPKLILIASELAGNEKVRKTLLYVLFFSLGLIMLIFVVFIGLISGLLSIAQDNDLRNHWNYYRTSISEIFSSIEGEINSDVKSEVYDFMPEFSVNFSKATIANNFDNSSLILYDEKEIRQAQEIMLNYAEKLREITTEEAFDSFISGYETELSFSDIRNIRFTDDTGIDGISAYPDAVKLFLYNRAMEQMPAYSYSFEEITVDEKPADRQTLVVTSPDGSAQTVEYTCIGGGEVYLPEFLAMYNICQSREYLTAVTQNQAPDIETQIEQAVGGIPETAEEAQDYLNGAWQGMVDGRGAVNLDLFRMANLKSIIEGASIDGAVKISTERTSDKLSITLETVGSDIWEDIFGIDEELKQYVEQSQIAPGGNGILSQCGEVSEFHQYTYGKKDMGVPEKGITLALKEKTAVHANLLDCGDCIQDIYVYDVWNMDEQDIANDTNSKVFNRSAVTLAYIIDTAQFEADYGFPFPSIDGVSNNGMITLFLEFTCLSEVEFEDADIGSSLDFGDIIVGYSHEGYYSGRYDSGLWRHSLNRDECVPHVGVKTYFMSGEVSRPEPPQGTHYYCGPSAKDIGATANPRLWFKGFRTGMSEELFGTIHAVGKER